MDITSSQGTNAYRTHGSSLTRMMRPDGESSLSSIEQVKRRAEQTPDYRVDISAAGRRQSLARFSRTQQYEKNRFDRSQQMEESAKDRELSAEKRQFEQQQAADQRNFEANQRLEKRKFLQTQSIRSYA